MIKSDRYDLSIIIPVYNSELYLSKLLNSILNGKKESKFEILLINDGSTDASLNICKLYKMKNENIKLISIPNSGVSKARNIGIDNAKGTFIVFLDADDDLPESFWDCYLEYSEKNKADLSIGAFINKTFNGDIKKGPNRTKKYVGINDIAKLMKNNTIDDMTWFLNVLWNKIFVLDIIKKNHIRFIDICPGEDMVFICEYLKNIDTIYLSERIVYNYYTRNTSSLVNSFYSAINQIYRRQAVYNAQVLMYKHYGIWNEIKAITDKNEGLAVYAGLHSILKTKISIESAKDFVEEFSSYENYHLINLYLSEGKSLKKRIERCVFRSNNSFLIVIWIRIKGVINHGK